MSDIAEASFVLGEGLVRPGSSDCICDWPDTCGGDGTLVCNGCGPLDLCACPCGGSQACFGCDDCEDPEDD